MIFKIFKFFADVHSGSEHEHKINQPVGQHVVGKWGTWRVKGDYRLQKHTL